MRIGSMVKMLLEEVRAAPLDEPSRERLAEIYERSIVELSDALSPDLQHELKMLALPFRDGEVPTEGEIRVAKAQLVGWLEGLFHGIQATLFAQQLAARQQLEQIRQLPPGMQPGQIRARSRTPRHVPVTVRYGRVTRTLHWLTVAVLDHAVRHRLRDGGGRQWTRPWSWARRGVRARAWTRWRPRSVRRRRAADRPRPARGDDPSCWGPRGLLWRRHTTLPPWAPGLSPA